MSYLPELLIEIMVLILQEPTKNYTTNYLSIYFYKSQKI